MPVNLIFVGMIWTSFFALKNLGVPMATVLKNVTNLFTIVGDYLLYGKVRRWALLALLCMSVLSGFITDLTFNDAECLWRSILKVKCLQTSAVGACAKCRSSAGAHACAHQPLQGPGTVHAVR